jgi:hypothetical protein
VLSYLQAVTYVSTYVCLCAAACINPSTALLLLQLLPLLLLLLLLTWRMSSVNDAE